MINRQAKLSIGRQSQLLAISRGTVYYQPKEICETDLLMMLVIDRLHTDFSFSAPEIVNKNQGSQFSAQEFVRTILDHGCKVSMDGRGAWRDNVMVERL